MPNLTLEDTAKQAGVSRGCIYYERCPVADIALGCKEIQPEPVEIERGHSVVCYRALSR